MKTITLEIDAISARIVAMIAEYNIDQLKQAEQRDAFKDNSPYIKALEDFLKAYESAKK